MQFRVWVVALCLSFCAGTVLGQGMAPAKPDPAVVAQQLNYRTGPQSLGGVADVQGQTLAVLDVADGRKLLVDVWENPPQSANGILGILVPRRFDALSPDSWAIVVRYEKTGYVSDSDADSIDYDELLQDMQESARLASAERIKQGYPGIELVGWASKPYYDKATHKLHWAKELRFLDSTDNTLNYNLRVLGRQGVLELNFIGNMAQLSEIRTAIPRVMSEVNFKPGFRYEEFDSSVDEVAGYGLAALIAGGVLKKAGILGAIVAVLVGLKKFIFVGVIAVIGGIVAIVRRRRARRPVS
jgi:uncharacterized membrane-anchored protein